MNRGLIGTLSTSVAIALLAGCHAPPASSSVVPESANAAPTATRFHAGRARFQVLYRFPGYAIDGWNPQASLMDVNGTLYGTTEYGGSGTGCQYGCGTVFSIGASGTEKILHDFTGGSDGSHPVAALTDVDGTLYGTTSSGGSVRGCYGDGCGTVFSITTSGSETVLHAFPGPPDGAKPQAPLIELNGTLYGTTSFGGKTSSGFCQQGCGTVYSMTPSSSTEKVLHAFTGGDGWYPVAGLTEVNGILYGTTIHGGGAGCGGFAGCGTVFGITKSGREKLLHGFGGGSDGDSPQAGLIDLNGILYGTTNFGGTSSRYGTVYSITTGGVEKVLHAFTGGSDGYYPLGGLTAGNGKLYGTTAGGGRTGSCGRGCGTIFSVTTAGAIKSFSAFARVEAAKPSTTLLEVNGTLYGTTPHDLRGRGPCKKPGHCGAVFSFRP